LEAQDASAPRLCGKCFATVGADAPFCPECGAALDDASHPDGSDAAIYPELARANLLRMRGDYKAAEEVCLGILRRFPNNATANGLLGDIGTERGDLEQAAEWYELALDIVPDSDTFRDKLNRVKAHLAERETAHTAHKIGLPMSAPKTGIYALTTVLLIVTVGVASYFYGSRAHPPPPVMDTRIDVSSHGPEPAPPSAPTAAAPEPADVQPTPRTQAPWTDATLLETLRGELEQGARLLDAWEDPRTRSLLVTVSGSTDEAPRTLAAHLGLAAIQRRPNAPQVTVRVVLDGRLVFVGDVLRSGALAIASPEFREEAARDPDLWIDRILANEWEASPSGSDEVQR